MYLIGSGLAPLSSVLFLHACISKRYASSKGFWSSPPLGFVLLLFLIKPDKCSPAFAALILVVYLPGLKKIKVYFIRKYTFPQKHILEKTSLKFSPQSVLSSGKILHADKLFVTRSNMQVSKVIGLNL
ncbi:unnamed protein product [Cuscuta europaea]|uniref:Uncharacterized protein n=1 Tax=Cuscuta europaea TaxID=41803 RepID=A0A9P0YUB3_CUSEU|nr:unnamed protein product [Cuscuta europaea]